MTEAGAPRPGGRHASPDDESVVPPTRSAGRSPEPPYGRRATDSWTERNGAREDDDTAAWAPARSRPDVFAGVATGSSRRPARGLDATGAAPTEWRHRGGHEEPGSGGGVPAWSGTPGDDGRHPSAPLPPPPPGAWSRLAPRPDTGDDAPTQAQPLLPPAPGFDEDDDATQAHALDPRAFDPPAADRHPDEDHLDDDPDDHPDDQAAALPGWEDHTGGLEVIGAHVDDTSTRRGRRRRRAEAREAHPDVDLHEDDLHDDVLHDDDLHDDVLHDDDFHDEDLLDEDGPVRSRRGGTRRRRRPIAMLLVLLVFGGLVAGAVVGGQRIVGLFQSEDYSGQGTGSVDVTVQDGDTLSDIARTLVDADVVASVKPFVDAAEANPDATGITAGTYRLRQQMSGAAALALLLDPTSRQVSRVTLPEGLRAVDTLQRIADETGVPLADLQAAAADPAALGLPAYANGSLEGFLFPATYDVEPGDTAADILSGMIARTVQALDTAGVPDAQRLQVLTEASLVQAEASTTDDMAKVARVLDNRIAISMPLQLDTTVNYASGKDGITTTAEDRANQSPYNTYVHPGLPPGPIDNPGEEAIQAVLNPAQGNWLFFVVVNPDTGETRFAATAEEHAANVALFQQWLRANPGG